MNSFILLGGLDSDYVSQKVVKIEKTPKGYLKIWAPFQKSNGRRCPECDTKLLDGAGCHACWFCADCGIGGCDNAI